MVYAFIIHTLFPGQCKILFHQIYSTFGNANSADGVEDTSVLKAKRKKEIEFAAAQIHSEYAFRRSTANRTVEDDVLALSQEDQLPEFELGFLRFAAGEPFDEERVAVWLGAGNTGFTLICHKEENRLLAESVLKAIIRYLQEYLRVLQQPAEAALKADRVCLILGKFLPDGALMFMNHRVMRGLEKKLEILMKT